MHMKTVTNYDIQDDERLLEMFKAAYYSNEDVLIPKDMLLDFIHTGCRITICKDIFRK